MNYKKILRHALCGLVIATALTACKTPENIAYLQGASNDQILLETINVKESAIKIEPFDKITIVVTSKDASTASLFNLNVMSGRLGSDSPVSGTGTRLRDYSLSVNEGLATFTVSDKGTIDYPVLGTLKIAGMTRHELAAFIKGEIMGKGILNDPVVTVEFVNAGFSVLGEVNRTGRYDLNVDMITLLEGLALAGDIGIQGKRENVTVVRRENGQVKTYQVDLTKTKELVSSPVYYLKQGDVIYVEPNNQKKRQSIVNGNNVMSVSFWVSVASLLTSAAILIK